MVRRAGRPLDDGVAGTGWTVVAPILTGRRVMVSRGRRLEILGLVAAARATAHVMGATAAQEVRASGTAATHQVAAPLQLLQLRAVVIGRARHSLRRDAHLYRHSKFFMGY